MKPVLALRIGSGLYLFFAFAHTYGFNFLPSRGVLEEALFAGMRGYTFNMQGFTRSHWDFLRGHGHITTVALLLMAVLAWQVAGLAKANPQAARPLVLTLLAASIALTVLTWMWFFTAPAVTATLATLAFAAAWLELGKA